MRFKRILLKLSGESLAGDGNVGLDSSSLTSIARQIKAIHDEKVQVAVVVGAGNIFRGAALVKSGIERTTADYMGMLATIMNALAIQDVLEKLRVPTRVQSAITMQEIAEPYIRRRAMRHLEKGRVVIFAGGIGDPFFTTDTTAALRGIEVGAQVFLKATKVDGVYDKDPVRFPKAKRFKRLSFEEALSKDLKVLDDTAFVLCRDNKLPIVVFDIFKRGNLLKVVNGHNIGTLIS